VIDLPVFVPACVLMDGLAPAARQVIGLLLEITAQQYCFLRISLSNLAYQKLFTRLVQNYIRTVLWHCWLGDTKGI